MRIYKTSVSFALKIISPQSLALMMSSRSEKNVSFLPFRPLILGFLFSLIPAWMHAQTNGDAEGNLDEVLLAVFVITVVMILLVVYVVADKLLKISAERTLRERLQEEELNDKLNTISLFPNLKGLLIEEPKKASYLGDHPIFHLKKGYDIKIQGRAPKKIGAEKRSTTYSIKPTDFYGMAPIPKLMVEVGDEVKAGDPLFFDKNAPEILYTAPVSGEVVEVRRADKRAIAEVIILADQDIQFKSFPKVDPFTLSRSELIQHLCESGLWPSIRQRPFNVVANPADLPKYIYVSCFDSNPLAANFNFTLKGEYKAFQMGIDALNKLTEGGVHLGLPYGLAPCDTFDQVKGAKKYFFDGPHPAGNVGIQIHHINPINKGEKVWHVHAYDVIVIGRLFLEGRYNTERLIAIAGPEVLQPGYQKVYRGANVEQLLSANLTDIKQRVISGSVLTGTSIGLKGHLGFFDTQISVIEEGDFQELFGWLLPSYARPSISNTFPWKLFPEEEFKVNTNTHGEGRAFVVTGQYESVLPMDIYPVHLLKAIMARDFDMMEGLGIYEVEPEDLALCEFVCTSKTNVQEIMREGIDYVREQS